MSHMYTGDKRMTYINRAEDFRSSYNTKKSRPHIPFWRTPSGMIAAVSGLLAWGLIMTAISAGQTDPYSMVWPFDGERVLQQHPVLFLSAAVLASLIALVSLVLFVRQANR